MRAKHSSSSCRALAFGPLLLPLLLLAAGGSHPRTTAEQTFGASAILSGNQLLVPNRTHTFASYLSDAAFTGLVPVFVGTSMVLQGTYAQDTIVGRRNGCGAELRAEQGQVFHQDGVLEPEAEEEVHQLWHGPGPAPASLPKVLQPQNSERSASADGEYAGIVADVLQRAARRGS